MLLCNRRKDFLLSPESVAECSGSTKPRIPNDEGGFKPAARLGGAGIAALPDVTITSQRGCQTPPRRPRALAAPRASSSVVRACEEKAPVFYRRFCSVWREGFLTLRWRPGGGNEDPKAGRRFCEELRCWEDRQQTKGAAAFTQMLN